MARPIARSHGSPPSCWPRHTVPVSKPAPAPAALCIGRAEISQKSELRDRAEGHLQGCYQQVHFMIMFPMFCREMSHMRSLKGLRGSFSEVNWCWLGFSNMSGAYLIYYWVQASFDFSGCLLALWRFLNALENVVHEQFGVDIPFISGWGCSTFAAFQNTAYFINMGTEAFIKPLRTQRPDPGVLLMVAVSSPAQKSKKLSMGISENTLRISWCAIVGSGFQPKASVEWSNKWSSCSFFVAAYNYSSEIARVHYSYRLQSSA